MTIVIANLQRTEIQCAILYKIVENYYILNSVTQ